MDTIFYSSALGLLRITGNGKAVTELNFEEKNTIPATAVIPAYLKPCVHQLDEYFAGTRQEFDITLAFERGTPFQQGVWQALCGIPHGRTASYGDIAKKVASPKAVRAVGQANNRNPICIIVPCHRVIGSNGAMVGYGGGLWRKEWLLAHEGVMKAKNAA